MKHVRCAMWVAVVLGCILCVGCKPSEDAIRIQTAFDRTREQCNVQEIRTGVTPLYGRYREYEGDKDEIPSDQIPGKISSLPLFLGAQRYEIMAFVPHTNELMFMTGSGFGHWGIIICKDAAKTTVEGFEADRVKLWKDGVFFYTEVR